MPDPIIPTPDEMRVIDEARVALVEAALVDAAVTAELNDARAVSLAAEDELERLRRTGGTAAQIAAASSKVRKTLEQVATLGERRSEVIAVAANWRDVIDALPGAVTDPATALAGGIPVALLPVRLETRFVGGALKVRIYPDTIHVDQLERSITADELVHAQAYWRERWNAPDTSAAASIWERYVSGHAPGRVAWIVRVTTPENLDTMGTGEPSFPAVPIRPDGPSTVPIAALLPSRWTVVGYRGGAEVFRSSTRPVAGALAVGLAPDATTAPLDPDTLPDVQPALAVDDGMRWLVEYDRAEQVGMAVTITEQQVSGGLAAGFDRLVVVGIDHRATPDAAAQRLAAVLDAHTYTDGFGFVAPGTATNATADAAVAARPTPADPTRAATNHAGDTASGMLAAALGIADPAVLHRAHGASLRHDPHGADMWTALWEPTLGYFCRQMLGPILSDGSVAELRSFVVRHLRGRGPLPAIRVGDQPLAVLPIVASRGARFDGAAGQIAAVLDGLRPLWSSATGTIGRVGDSGDPAADLTELMGRTARSAAVRIRNVLGSIAAANADADLTFVQMQQAVAQLTLALLGVHERPAIVDTTVADDQAVLPVPVVTGEPLSDVNGLDPDFFARTLDRLTTRGAFRLLRTGDPESAASLLEALVIHAANLELDRAALGWVVQELALDIDVGVALEDHQYRPEIMATDRDERIEVLDAGTPSARLNIRPTSLASRRIVDVSGTSTIGDWLSGATVAQLVDRPATAQHGEFRAALTRLSGVSTRALHDATLDVLDVVSHRLDAWYTALASERLAAQRSTHAVGVHVGGFGWVDDLRPAVRRASAGYVHAPSVAQATTAAILRSGHLARGGGEDEQLSIALSSRRTRDALKLIDGMRSGQPLAALLGYRFERALRDRNMVLAAFIRPTRLRFPLAGTGDSDTSGAPQEAIAARDVVDGITLAELDAAARAQYLDSVGASGADRAAIVDELDHLRDLLDAVGDLLLAEGVHQVVAGNAERSAAALDVLDRQTPPPEPAVSRTPRTGNWIGHRVLIELATATKPRAWPARDARAAAEPRVDAWVAQLLGSPDRYRFTADIVGADGGLRGRSTIALRDLGVSALSAVRSTARGSDGSSEFDLRLAAAFRAAVPASLAGVPDLSLRARPDVPQGSRAGSIGLAGFLGLASRITDVLGSTRSATVRDIAHPNRRDDAAIDVVEIAGRADKLAHEVRQLVAIGDVTGLTDAALRKLLHRAAALGVPGSFDDSGRAANEAAWSQVHRTLSSTAGLLDELDRSLAPAPSSMQLGDHHTARIRAVLGADFPVVPVLTLPGDLVSEMNSSAGDSAMLGPRPLAATEWLMRHTRVRPSVERLWSLVATAEAFTGAAVGAAHLDVVQLPHVSGAPWVGLPEAAAHPGPTADVSIVSYRVGVAASTTRYTTSFAGLVVDQWSEQIPSKRETTGISFHFDAPGARAPQTMLLAVHPDPSAPAWSTDALLDTVVEAADLTRIRMLDLDDVTAVGRFLPAAYAAFNLEREVPTLDWAKVIATSHLVWKKFP